MTMDSQKNWTKTEHVEELEATETKTDSDREGEKEVARVETTMNKTKWLACIALCISYSTAFQQNAVTAAIAKHIDDELGEDFSYFLPLVPFTFSAANMT
jgi:hypothetical protein